MITAEQTIVYRAPTAGRRYITKAGAIHAEAVAIIQRKHPTEGPESDTGHYWHWRSDMPRAEVLLRRMKRLVKKSVQPKP